MDQSVSEGDPFSIQIGGRIVGDGAPPYVIAEVAQAHDGSLGLAHCFIDAAAEAGVDAVKFQTHFARDESTLDEPFRVKFSKQDQTRFDYWKRMEFNAEEWAGLADHARERGLDFLSSAFSLRAIELLDRLGMPAWKIASGEVGSQELLGAIAMTGKPILLSSGMSRYDEIAATVERLRGLNLSFAVFQCTSRYPTPFEEVGLNVLDELRSRFRCPVGLSDHTGSIFAPIAAIARGAHLIEAHLTLDRRMFGPDVPVSLTVEEFRIVCEARDAIHRMDANPVDKDAMADELAGMRELFQRSVALVEPLAAGAILTREALTTKKPAIGIPASELDRVVGRRLARAVTADRVLKWGDLDEQ